MVWIIMMVWIVFKITFWWGGKEYEGYYLKDKLFAKLRTYCWQGTPGSCLEEPLTLFSSSPTKLGGPGVGVTMASSEPSCRVLPNPPKLSSPVQGLSNMLQLPPKLCPCIMRVLGHVSPPNQLTSPLTIFKIKPEGFN